MAQLGVVESENAFYQTFYEKWQEYLSRLSSGQKLISVIGHDLTGPEDVKAHMEEIRIYMRGHNMFDCFYGRFKKEENEWYNVFVRLETSLKRSEGLMKTVGSRRRIFSR